MRPRRRRLARQRRALARDWRLWREHHDPRTMTATIHGRTIRRCDLHTRGPRPRWMFGRVAIKAPRDWTPEAIEALARDLDRERGWLVVPSGYAVEMIPPRKRVCVDDAVERFLRYRTRAAFAAGMLVAVDAEHRAVPASGSAQPLGVAVSDLGAGELVELDLGTGRARPWDPTVRRGPDAPCVFCGGPVADA